MKLLGNFLALALLFLGGCQCPKKEANIAHSVSPWPMWTASMHAVHSGLSAYPSELIAEINGRLRRKLMQIAPGESAVCVAYPIDGDVRVELYMATASEEVSKTISSYARELIRHAESGKLPPEEEANSEGSDSP